MREASAVLLSSEARGKLQKLLQRLTTPVRMVERCRIILLAAKGVENMQIAAQLHVAPRRAALCRGSFLALGAEGVLRDAQRSGRKPTINPQTIAEVIAKTTQGKPEVSTHGSRCGRWHF